MTEMKRTARRRLIGPLIGAMLAVVAATTWADSLIIQPNQVIHLGLAGVSTNYSFDSITIEQGGTLAVIGDVTLNVASNVLVNGDIVGGSDLKGLRGADGAIGADGASPSENGGNGGFGANGGDVGAGPILTINAHNMTVNGSINFDADFEGGDGGDGGDGGNGADGQSPVPGRYRGGSGGYAGYGGTGGAGGNVIYAPELHLYLHRGNFVLATNGVISLDSPGKGGDGGNGGDGKDGGNGGDSIKGAEAGDAGIGGDGGYGGAGGMGGAGGTVEINEAASIDLEGHISLRGGDGGDGGNSGKPGNGGNGGNGSLTPPPNPQGYGSDGGDGSGAGNSSSGWGSGGSGGNGGSGGSLLLLFFNSFTNHATFDFSGGAGGNGGKGQPAGVGIGGHGGQPGGTGARMGYQGSNSVVIPYGLPGLPGAEGAMSVGVIGVNNKSLPDNLVGTSGKGSVSAENDTLGISAGNGVFRVRCWPADPRYQTDSETGQYVMETNEPLDLKIAYQWLTTSGSLNVLLGGQLLTHLEAPSVLTNGVTTLDLSVTGRPPDSKLDFQLNGPAQIQFSDFSLQSLPLLPLLSLGASPTNAAALDLNWYGASNQTYQVQYRASLNGGGWTNFGSPVSGQGAAASLALPALSDKNPNGFYRVVMTPGN